MGKTGHRLSPITWKRIYKPKRPLGTLRKVKKDKLNRLRGKKSIQSVVANQSQPIALDFAVYKPCEVPNFNTERVFSSKSDSHTVYYHYTSSKCKPLTLENADDLVVLLKKNTECSGHAKMENKEMRNGSFLEAMPYDISILCSDNNIVKGHKFVLAYHSLFFRAKFNPNGGGKLKGGTSEKVVNLKDFTFATGVLMTIIIDIMYDHWPERLLPISTILGLFYLSDLLIMDNDWMSKLWTAALTCVRGNLDFTLKMLQVAEQVNCRLLSSKVMVWSQYRHEENRPLTKANFFNLLPWECLVKFLRMPEAWGESVDQCHPIHGLPAVQREQFLIDVAFEYLKHNPQHRKRAPIIFKCLRLSFVWQEFQSIMSTSDLSLNEDLKLILEAGQPLKIFHHKFCTPRPNSVKCYFWSTPLASLQQGKNGNKDFFPLQKFHDETCNNRQSHLCDPHHINELANCTDFKCKCWERCTCPSLNPQMGDYFCLVKYGRIFIKAIGASFRRLPDESSSSALSSLAVQWSDGSIDYTPGWNTTDQTNTWIYLDNNDRITPWVASSYSFIETIDYRAVTSKELKMKNLIPEKVWDKQGQSVHHYVNEKVINSAELQDITFMDGFKGMALYLNRRQDSHGPDAGRPIIVNLSFKMSCLRVGVTRWNPQVVSDVLYKEKELAAIR